MPIFESNGKRYNVKDEHISSFMGEMPDATTIIDHDGKQYRVKAKDYNTFYEEMGGNQVEQPQTEKPQGGSSYNHYNIVKQRTQPYKDKYMSNLADDTQGMVQPQPQAEQEYIDTFGGGFKQGTEQLYQGLRASAAETANLVGGSSRDYMRASEQLDEMLQSGYDLSNYDSDKALKDYKDRDYQRRLTQWQAEMNKRRAEREDMDFFDKLAHKWNDPDRPKSQYEETGAVADEIQLARSYNIIRDALQETNGDVEAAKALIAERSKEKTWGDKQIEGALDAMSQMKETKGFGAWVGGMIPQMLGNVAGIAAQATGFGKLGALLGIGNMAALTTSSAGSSMLDARKYGASEGDVWKAGTLSGAIEAGTEAIPFARYFTKGQNVVAKGVDKLIGKAIGNNPKAAQEVTELIDRARKEYGTDFLNGRTLKEYAIDLMAEGASEAVAEGTQTLLPMLYQNPEDYPTLTEVLEGAWEGAKGGLFMGAFLGAGSRLAKHHTRDKVRKENGNVMFAETKENGIVEIFGEKDGLYKGSDAEGNDIILTENDIVETASVTYNEYMRGVKEVEAEQKDYEQNATDAYNLGMETDNGADIRTANKDAKKAASALGDEGLATSIAEAANNGSGIDGLLGGLDADKQQQAREYYNQQMRLKGIRDRVENEIKEAIALENDEIDRLSDNNGMYLDLTITQRDERGEEVQVSGNVVGYVGGAPVWLPDGAENTAENRRILKPTEYNAEDLNSAMPKDEVKARMADIIRKTKEDVLENYLNYDPDVYDVEYGSQFQVGETTYVPLNQNEFGETIYQAIDAEGNAVGVPTVVTADKMYAMMQEAKDAAEQQAERSAERAKNEPIIQLKSGQYVMATQMSKDNVHVIEVDEQGNPVSNPEIDENVDYKTYDAWKKAHEEQQQAQQAVQTNNVSAESAQNEVAPTEESEQNVSESVQPSEELADESASEAVASPSQPTIPTEGEEVLYHKVPVDVTLADLNDGTLDEVEQDEFIAAKKAEAAKMLDNLNKKKPKVGTNKAKYLAEKQAWEQKVAEAQSRSDYWNNVEKAMRDSRVKVGDAVAEEVMQLDQAMNGAELAAQMLAQGRLPLLQSSYKEETGYGQDETQGMFGLFRSAENGGMTIDHAAELLALADEEEHNGHFFGGDSEVARNTLLQVLSEVQTRGGLNNYISNIREQQAKAEQAAEYEAYEQGIQAMYGVSVGEYEAAYNDYLNNNPTDGVDMQEIDAIFAEDALSEEEQINKIDNGQGTISEGTERSNEVLLEEQPDNEGRVEESKFRGQAEGDVSSSNDTNEVAQGESRQILAEAEAQEDMLAMAERIANEEKRRKPLRERARELERTLGVKVNLIERIEDVPNRAARAAIEQGQNVTGWYEQSTGEVCFYMPNLANESEVDATYIHEVVAHKGLRGLLGDKFDAFCDDVWDMMSDADKARFINYPGVNGDTRAAADEYIAHLAENVDVTESAWSKFTELLKKFLKAIGIEPKMTDADIANAIKQSYQRLLSGEQGENVGEGTRFMVKKGGIRVPDDEYAKIAHQILTYPEKEERGHVFTDNYYYLCTDIDDNGNFRIVASIKIEGNEEFIRGIRKGLPLASFVPISESESIIPFIDRIRNEGGRISRNYAFAERQSKTTRRNDSVYLGKQTKSTRNKQVSDTDDGTSKFRIASNRFENGMSNDELHNSEQGVRFRAVTDPLKIAELEAGKKVKVYRAMQLVDGKLYPPMSAKVNGKMRDAIELGRWEEAEERPEMADDKGYFKLDKGNGKSLKARYNPYIHTSTTPLNDQFSSAQDRPELVTVEVEIPESELTSGYKADKAKDAVGKLEWKAGVVQGKLSGTRTVILSRWDKPIRIVPDSEVADDIVKMFGDKQITMPSNVVTPSLRAELEKRGVPFVETDNQGKEVGGTRFKVVYHGSAADFDKFDHSKIGSGAGSQVFGWGTYVTDSEKIGRDYGDVALQGRNKFKYVGSKDVNKWVLADAEQILDRAGSYEEAMKRYGNATLAPGTALEEAVTFLKSTSKEDWEGQRHLYEVEIPDMKRGNYIVYGNTVTDKAADKVFDGIYERVSKNEEYDSEFVKKELRRELDSLREAYGQGKNGIWKDLYGDIATYLGSEKEASLFLRSLGYVGIEYPSGTIYKGEYGDAKNYVIFDEGDLKIANNIRFRVDNISSLEPSKVVDKIKDCFYNDASKSDRIAMVEYLQQSEEGKDVIDRLYKHNGTGWAKQTVNATFVRIALNDLLEGRKPSVSSMLTREREHSVVKLIKQSGKEGVWRYVQTFGILGEAGKPINNVNGSFLSCNPSNECAKYCYATKGNYIYASSSVKSELVYWAIKNDPIRAAQRIIAEYKTKPQYYEGKALRLFDKGDIDNAWLPVIEELNKQGVVTQIFSKRPSVLENVDRTMNVVMMSIDSSNTEMLDDYPTMPIALVYRGNEDLALLESCKERFKQYGGVILPVKIGQRLLSEKEIKSLPLWTRPYQCPIDNGKRLIKDKENPERSWNCTKCDKNGGVGCFFKRTAERLRNEYENERKSISGSAERDNQRTSTGNAESSNGRSVSLHSTNRVVGDIEFRRELLQTLRESLEEGGLSNADITPKLLETLDRRLRGMLEGRGMQSTTSALSRNSLEEPGDVGQGYEGRNRPKSDGRIKSDGTSRFRVSEPALDYAEEEDVVDVQSGDVVYTLNNVDNQLYKTSGKYMRRLYKNGEIGRVLKGEYAEIDQIKAREEYNHAKPILEEYLSELEDMRSKSSNAAQRIIDGVISDIEYALDYYKNLSLGKDVWRTDAAPRFRVSDAPFYSNAERAVEGIKQEKATPQQWLAMIEKNGGLKAGEDKWLGLSDWLKGQDAKSLTKQEVLDYINANQIQIEEVHYGGGEWEAKLDAFNEEFRELIDEGEEATGSIYTSEWVDYAYEAMVDRYGDDFRDAFEVAGQGTAASLEATYDWNDNLSGAAQHYLGVENPINSTREDYTTGGLENKREIALVVPTIESWNKNDEVHFGDAGDGRAVAWVRFGETTDEDGNSVLVIDEIQSKRHQEGREKGYFDAAAHRRKTAELNEELDNVVEERMKLIESLRKKYPNGYMKTIDWVDDNGMMQRKMVVDESKVTNEEHNRYNELSAKIVNLHLALHDHNKSINWDAVQSAPFEKNWHELAMKRMLRYAAENGYDKVAWTKGAQQAERYDLSAVVDHISYYENEDGTLDVRAYFPQGGYQPIGKTLDEVESNVGKDIAKKIKEGVSEKTETLTWGMGKDGNDINKEYKVLAGDNLKVGGEGMKGFYDKMLPSFMNKYGKKWGVKVGEVELPHVEESAQKMWSVDVTDAMKDSVMEGQPMFRISNGGLTNDQVRALEFVTGKSREEVVRDYGKPKNRISKKDAIEARNEMSKFIPRAKNTLFYNSVSDLLNPLSGISALDKAYIIYTKLKGIQFRGFYNGHNKNVVLLTEYISNKDRAKGVIIHEYTHLVVNKLLKDGVISESELDDVLAFCKRRYPDIYRKATIGYKESAHSQECISYLNEHFYGMLGDKFFEDATFAGKSKHDKLFSIILNELKNEEGTNGNNPNNGRKGWSNLSLRRGSLYGRDDERGGRERGVQATEQGRASGDSEGVRFRVSEEEQSIIDAAKKDGTYMLAPNGNPTNLTEKQWAQVRTKAFKKWFGDWENDPANASKVVDENGEPMVVYHGTPWYGFTEFIPGNGEGSPIYLAVNRAFAQSFADKHKGEEEYFEQEGSPLNPNVYDLFINVRNPIDLGSLGEMGEKSYETIKKALGVSDAVMSRFVNSKKYTVGFELLDFEPEFNKLIRKLGYDGVYGHESGSDYGNQWAVYNSSQIKSATDNVGTFDEKNSDIRFRVTPEMDAEYAKAVERGDMDAAQKMVDEAARNAGYTQKAYRVDEYSGDRNKYNNVFGGVFYAESLDYFKHTATGHKAEKAKPFYINTDGFFDPMNEMKDLFANSWDDIVGRKSEFDKFDIEDESHADRGFFNDGDEVYSASTDGIAMAAQRIGRKGVILRDIPQNIYGDFTEFAVFDSESVKSAEPATYDDNGNLIPLSERFDSGKDDIRFRVGNSGIFDDAGNEVALVEREVGAARDQYERTLRTATYQFQEAMQDSMLALKVLQKSIAKATNSRILDFENAWMAENALSSMSLAEMDAYREFLFKPLLQEIANLEKEGLKYDEISDYLITKHGIERNREMAVREALKQDANTYKQNLERWNAEKQAVWADDTKTWEEQQAELDRIAVTYGANLSNDYSGLSAMYGDKWSKPAYDAVKSFEAAHDTKPLYDALDAATGATIDKPYESGLMSKESHEGVKQMFQFYVPLRGWEEETSADVYEYLTTEAPAFNAPLKKMNGRKSKADDPIATLANVAESAILQGNRNKMKQKFLNMVMNHKSDAVSVSNLWLSYDDVTKEWKAIYPEFGKNASAEEVERITAEFNEKMEQLSQAEPNKYKKASDANDIPYKTMADNLNEHQVIVKRNGKTYVLTINGNPRAAQALNGLTNPDNDANGAIGAILKSGEWLNRQLSAFYTTRNPNFMASNFLRDAIYSNTMAWVKESPAYAWNFNVNFAKVNPKKLHSLIRKYRNGKLDMSNPMEKAFSEFIKNGGETGYTNLRDVEKQKKVVKRELKKAKKMNLTQALDMLSERFDDLNRSIENCARFAAFLTSRQQGRSIERSVFDAKEISVNFNKKGAGAKFMGTTGETKVGNVASFISGLGRAGFVFWNAGVQGLYNFGKAAANNPIKFTTACATFYLLGALMPMLADADDDDDDELDNYENLPDYVRRTNICFRNGFGDWVTIPLPIELRALYGLGEMSSMVLSGKEKVDALKIAEQLSQVMPIDMLEGEGGLKAFVPSSVKPIVEAYVWNKDWTGLPIYKDTPFNKEMPEWTKVYKNADPMLVKLSQWSNEFTRGKNDLTGWANWNPAKVEHLLEGYFGGVATTIEQMSKSAQTIAGTMEFDWRNIPIGSRVIKSGNPRVREQRINNEYFDNIDRMEELRLLRKQFESNAQTDDLLERAKWIDEVRRLDNDEEYKNYQTFKKMNTRLKKLEEKYKETQDENLKAEILDLKDAMNDVVKLKE